MGKSTLIAGVGACSWSWSKGGVDVYHFRAEIQYSMYLVSNLKEELDELRQKSLWMVKSHVEYGSERRKKECQQ